MKPLYSLYARERFSPVHYPNCAVYLNPDDFAGFSFNNTVDVSAWVNRGNKGVGNATKGTAADQPLYLPSGMNGKPCVQFYDDSVAKQLVIADHAGLDFAGGSGFTWFAAFERVADLGAEMVFGKWETVGGNKKEFQCRIASTDKIQNFYSADASTDSGGPSTGSSAVAGTPVIASGWWDKANSNLGVRLNKEAAVTTGSVSAIFNGASPLYIGSHSSTKLTPCALKLRHVILYTDYLSTDRYLNVLNWLGQENRIAL